MYLFFETKLFAYLGIFIVVVIELILLKKEKKKIKLQFFKRLFFHTDFYFIINYHTKLHYCLI